MANVRTAPVQPGEAVYTGPIKRRFPKVDENMKKLRAREMSFMTSHPIAPAPYKKHERPREQLFFSAGKLP